MMDLTVMIPSRNEEWLKNTIDDVMAHREAKTEVIVVLDGAWPVEPIPDHPDVHLIYVPESIGQRAATNLAARVSTAKYLMKLDAHCAVDQGFDRKLIEPYETGELEWNVTTIPRLFNLHVFNLVCDKCGKETYQGPQPIVCADCKGDKHRKRVVWQPRLNRKTDAMLMDCDLRFGYWSSFSKRPEAKGDFIESLGNLGACFFMHRDRYSDIGGLDEEYGSWGSFGSEMSCKAWLSGGRQVASVRTWYGHCFRTQGGSFSFPYHLSGRQVEHARKRLQSIWFNNAWPKQVRPLSWLIERFAPVPSWHEPSGAEALSRVASEGAKFTLRNQSTLPLGREGPEIALPALGSSVVSSAAPCVVAAQTDQTMFSGATSDIDGGEQMPAVAVSLAGGGVAAHVVFDGEHESKVGRVAASSVVANKMVNLEDVVASSGRNRAVDPGENEPMDVGGLVPIAYDAVAVLKYPGPLPASSLGVDGDLREDASELLAVEVGNCQHVGSHVGPPFQATMVGAAGVETPDAPISVPTLARNTRATPLRGGILFYTDNRGDPTILETVRKQLLRAKGDLPLVCVSLQPIPDFGLNVVVPLERSRLTMFKQIAIGLEVLDTDFVWHCEHDVAYHPSHFEFVPPTRDAYYYNEQTIKVDAATGQGVFYYTKQTSGLCADRQLLLEHYRKRVARVERDGYDHAMGYEPGCHQPPRGVDEYPAIRWMSRVPNVDIRHGCNLTKTRWDPAEFRDKSTCQGWTLVDEVPGWGVTKGRFREFLEELR